MTTYMASASVASPAVLVPPTAAAGGAVAAAAAAGGVDKSALKTVSDPWGDAKWIRELENDPNLIEVENRPWANWKNRRARAGCIGSDYVKDENTVLLRFFWNPKTAALTGAVHFTDRAEGPPQGAHGASVALVFDEILAYPVWASDISAFTVNLNVNFVKMVPLLSTLRFDSHIARRDGRKHYLEGTIRSGDGSILYSKATGIWLQSAQMGPTSIRSVL